MAPRIFCALLCCVLIAPPVAAQHLRDRIRELFTFGSCGRPLCLDGSVSAANGHGDHFLPDLIAGNSAVIGFLSDAIGLSAANTPISASGGGVTYRFVGGLPVRTSESAGPVFAERAQTLGRGRFVITGNLTGSSFRSLRGTPLDQLILNFTHQDVGTPGLGDPMIENDVLEIRLGLQVNLLVSTLAVTYGVSDAVDLGIAIPVVHTSLQGRSEGQMHPFGPTALHFFTGSPEDPGLRATSATFGSATGIGDIALRIKANLRSAERLGVALMADARVPTGDERDLLGSGHLALRALAILSGRFGDFPSSRQPGLSAPHWRAAGGRASRDDRVRAATESLDDDRHRPDHRVGNRGQRPRASRDGVLPVSLHPLRGAHQPAEHARPPGRRLAGVQVPDVRSGAARRDERARAAPPGRSAARRDVDRRTRVQLLEGADSPREGSMIP